MQNTRRAFAYLDVIFHHRNKAYGAYELRTRYPARLRRALSAVLFSVGLLALVPVLMSAISGTKPSALPPRLHDTTVFERPPLEQPKPKPKPEEPAKAKPVATQKVTPPIIVEDHRAQEENLLRKLDSTRVIASITRDGDTALPGDAPGLTTAGNGRSVLVEGTAKKLSGDVVEIVDILAEFPGDVRSFLASKLNYPDQAREAGVEGRVVIRFIVDEQGDISGAKIMRSVGGGCDEEALRVIRSMPRWKPAKLNGQVVKSYFSLPIKFTLEN